jgi:hypothetical protein
MHFPKRKIMYLLLAAFFCLMISSWAIAAGEDEEQAPTAENLWRAEQAGDIQKAEGIRAIMEQESKKSWRSPSYTEVPMDKLGVSPPFRDDSSYRLFNWGNDATIALGTLSDGISTDYDPSNNIYAVRCSTYLGTSNAYVKVYKSTNEGASWSYLCGFLSSGGSYSYSYPVILTGTSGDPDKLYIFFRRSSSNGTIGMARYTQSGTNEGFFNVKFDSDTIPYFSACANFGLGSRLMVAYQRNPSGSTTPDVYTIVSTDYGETWGGQVYITADGTHPDIAYGREGYVFLVYEKTGGSDDEIAFGRSTNYCTSGWEYFQNLTSDSWDDNYPKVAALHTTPQATPYVWVAYNHDLNNSGNIDLRFAYSSDGGNAWSKNHYLAYASDYDEMACDLWVGRNSAFTYVNICYLASRAVSYYQRWYDIYFGIANTGAPSIWQYLEIINDQWGAWDYDGRKVCQGTYGSISGYVSGVDFAGQTLDDNYTGLYFDSRGWTDVEDKTTEEEGRPGEFSLSDNYPNPFNPETKIRYTVGNKQTQPLSLKVYNVLGQLVKTLVNETKEPGTYEVIWDGKDESGDQVASGVYFYKLGTQDFSQTKKMVLIR